jgi:hypothetical protein
VAPGLLEKFRPNRHGFDEFFGFLGRGVDYFTHREPEKDGRICSTNGKPVNPAGYTTDCSPTSRSAG